VVYKNAGVRDVGWKHCLTRPNKMRDLYRVCRSYIQKQKDDFREREYSALEGWRCVRCGAGLIYSRDWLELYGIDPETIVLVPTRVYQGHSIFQDQRLAETWVDYHGFNAKLRCLCVPCHKKVTKNPEGETT
jgi:hypothetical protein